MATRWGTEANPEVHAPPLPPVRRVQLADRETTVVHDSRALPDSPTLILLHGLGATARLNWFTSFPALGHRFRVIAPDLRGHGHGVRAATPFTLEGAADDVIALADALGVDRFIPVGYSLGGPIAQLLWRRHPDRVSGLVMCATSYSFRATPLEHVMFAMLPALEQISRFFPEVIARRIIELLARPHLEACGFAEWALNELLLRDPRAVIQGAAALGEYSVERWITEIDVPTSVVVHTRDQLVPPGRQHALASAIPGARVHFVDGDHFAVVRDPQAFVPALVRAIADVVAASAPNADVMRRAS
jgi:3-oxoadipate enol-lactonase